MLLLPKKSDAWKQQGAILCASTACRSLTPHRQIFPGKRTASGIAWGHWYGGPELGGDAALGPALAPQQCTQPQRHEKGTPSAAPHGHGPLGSPGQPPRPSGSNAVLNAESCRPRRPPSAEVTQNTPTTGAQKGRTFNQHRLTESKLFKVKVYLYSL